MVKTASKEWIEEDFALTNSSNVQLPASPDTSHLTSSSACTKSHQEAWKKKVFKVGEKVIDLAIISFFFLAEEQWESKQSGLGSSFSTV